MRSSRARAGFAALLALSLAAKVAAAATAAEPDPAVVASAAAQLLRERGFEVTVHPSASLPLVYARSGGCLVMAGDYSPHGTYAPFLQALAAQVGRQRFAYRGALFDRPPATAALLRYYVQRELRRLGLRVERSPIVALAASAGCDLAAIDWRRLSSLPAEAR